MKLSEIDDFYLDDVSNHHAHLTSISSAAMNFAMTVGIMTLATFLSFLFRYIGFHESNIIVAFIFRGTACRKTDRRITITVLLPQFITHKWWQRWLHNQSADRIRSLLLARKDVVVSTVPYHLKD
jgi:hypothetical protein